MALVQFFIVIATIESTVTEVVRLSEVEWVPCYQRSASFVPISSRPNSVKPHWRKGPFYVDSKEHSVKGYADDATLISTSKEIHTTVLSKVDFKAREIGLLLKPSKCVSLLYDGSKFLSNGISLIGGTTKSIVEGPAKFLGKLIDISVHSTKIAAGKSMIDRFTTLLSKMSLWPEYKVWIYRNYILSIIYFHLTLDCVGPSTITKMENLATKYLKRWLQLP